MPDLVALQTLLPQIDSPVASQTKALQLQQLQQAQQDAEVKRQQTAQAVADDKATRAAYAANPSGGAGLLSALAGVSPKAYSTEAKSQSDIAAAGAKTSKDQIDAAHKKIDLAGQAFGYVRNNPTPENAMQAIQWLGQNGVYTPDQVAQYSAKVQSEPQNVKAMADQAFAAAVDTKQQLMKIETRDTGGSMQTIGTNPLNNQVTTLSTLAKTQTPDSIASNARIASEGAANRANQIKVQNMIGERQDAKGADDGSGLSDSTKQRIAQQVVDSGDYSGLKNLGRGTQGAKDLRAIQNAITDYASGKGMAPGDVSAKLAEFEGMKAGLRTSANISARIENAAEEAAQLAPLAINAGREVARSGFLPFGKAQVMFDNQTNDPAMNRFATANMGLATAYASAMARGNKPTVSDNDHARELLSTAKNQVAYEAIVDQMKQEIKAAQAAPQRVRDKLRGEISGKGGDHAAAAPAIPSGWSVKEH